MVKTSFSISKENNVPSNINVLVSNWNLCFRFYFIIVMHVHFCDSSFCRTRSSSHPISSLTKFSHNQLIDKCFMISEMLCIPVILLTTGVSQIIWTTPCPTKRGLSQNVLGLMLGVQSKKQTPGRAIVRMISQRSLVSSNSRTDRPHLFPIWKIKIYLIQFTNLKIMLSKLFSIQDDISFCNVIRKEVVHIVLIDIVKRKVDGQAIDTELYLFYSWAKLYFFFKNKAKSTDLEEWSCHVTETKKMANQSKKEIFLFQPKNANFFIQVIELWTLLSGKSKSTMKFMLWIMTCATLRYLRPCS